MVEDKFIENLSDNPIEGAKQICDLIVDFHNTEARGSIDRYSDYIELYALASSYFEAHDIDYQFPAFGEDKAKNINTLIAVAGDIGRKLEQKLDTKSIEHLKSKYQAKFKGGFCYEFTEGDIEKIQVHISELRKFISEYKGFEEGHRRRLLKRLEKLQSELHKKVSDLDMFWGLIGDAGVVIGKFGNDAKPMVERIKEVADIVWRTQSSAEELPSGTKLPLLSGDDGENT